MKRKLFLTTAIVTLMALIISVVALASPAWADDFEAYANGTVMQNVNGWKGWDSSPAAAGTISNAQANSGSNSMEIGPAADAVHEFTGFNTSGIYDITAMTYVPSTMTGQQYFIVLNTYADGGPNNWSLQILLDAANNQVIADTVFGGTATLIEDQWVELRANVNLDTDTQTLYYNGAQFATGSWTGGVSGGGALNIGAIDLFGNGASAMYYDDVSILPSPFQNNIAVNKTVSSDGSCGTSNTISVPDGTTVTYCYQITNTGNIDYDTHMVTDDQLGTVLPATNYVLAPGATFSFTTNAVFPGGVVTNTMTWMAWITGTTVMTQASATATVTGSPTDVVLTSFSGNGSVAWLLPVASLAVLMVLAGAMVLRRRQQS
jgi:hypothetical protein